MPSSGFTLSVDQRDIQSVGRAMKAQGDGKALRKDLIVSLRAAVQPPIDQIQGKLRATPHSGLTSKSPAMGTFLASRVKAQVRLSGFSTGVAVRMAKTPQLRGFAMASRRLNRTSWKHPVFAGGLASADPQTGSGRHRQAASRGEVEQISPMPDYFDDILNEDKELYRAAVVVALERMKLRLAARSEI
jgi:hypothetical protein